MSTAAVRTISIGLILLASTVWPSEFSFAEPAVLTVGWNGTATLDGKDITDTFFFRQVFRTDEVVDSTIPAYRDARYWIPTANSLSATIRADSIGTLVITPPVAIMKAQNGIRLYPNGTPTGNEGGLAFYNGAFYNYDLGGPIGPITAGADAFGMPTLDTDKGVFRGFFFGSTLLQVDVGPFSPGDFNYDGHIDGEDFLAWQRGSSPSPFAHSDLGHWQSNYGAGNMSAAITTPEPCSAVILLSMTCLAYSRRISCLCRTLGTRCSS